MPIAAAIPAIIGAGASIGGSLLNRKAGKKSTTQQRQEGQFNRQTTRDYDPGALDIYRDLQPQVAGVLSDYMTDPWRAGYFQKALGRSQEQIAQQGRTGMQGILSLLGQSSSGVGNLPAYLMAQSGANQRSTSRAQSDALTDLLLGSNELRLGASEQAQRYQPLELGQTSTGIESGTIDSTTTEKQGSILGDLLSGLGAALPGVVGATKGQSAPNPWLPQIGIPAPGAPLGSGGGNFFKKRNPWTASSLPYS